MGGFTIPPGELGIGFCAFVALVGSIFIKCAVKPRRLGRGYKAQSFKAGFVAAEYTV